MKQSDGCEVVIGEQKVAIKFQWPVDSTLFSAQVNEHPITVQVVDPLPLGFRLQHYGSKVKRKKKQKNKKKQKKKTKTYRRSIQLKKRKEKKLIYR